METSDIKNVIIIGRGIAAYTAALYTARANLRPTVLRGPELDQLSLTSVVENFPGFPEGILGPELITNVEKQAARFGVDYINELATGFDKQDDVFVVTTKSNSYRAKAVIIATGASARWLGVPGESDYVGRGVSTCATCDAAFFRDKTVVIVGGGDSAMEEALTLYKFASKITIIHRRGEFRASKIMQDRVFEHNDKIDIIWNSEVTQVLGDGKFVTGVKVKNIETEEEDEVKTDGMFLAIGHVTNTEIFKGKVELDAKGYIITDKEAKTSLAGAFAAGDCQDPIFKQAITSAGSGCRAAMSAEKYVEGTKNIEK